MAELEIDQSNLPRVNEGNLNRTQSIYRTMCIHIVKRGYGLNSHDVAMSG